MSVAPPPSATTLAAVLAAPPSTWRAAFTFRTGTGASGEILLQVPTRYSSRIASPRIRTRCRRKFDTYSTRGSAAWSALMAEKAQANTAPAGRRRERPNCSKFLRSRNGADRRGSRLVEEAVTLVSARNGFVDLFDATGRGEASADRVPEDALRATPQFTLCQIFPSAPA